MLTNYSNVELIHLVLTFIGCLNWFSQPSLNHSVSIECKKGDMLTPLQLKQCGLDWAADELSGIGKTRGH